MVPLFQYHRTSSALSQPEPEPLDGQRRSRFYGRPQATKVFYQWRLRMRFQYICHFYTSFVSLSEVIGRELIRLQHDSNANLIPTIKQMRLRFYRRSAL